MVFKDPLLIFAKFLSIITPKFTSDKTPVKKSVKKITTMAGILYHIEIPCHLCYIPYLFFQHECYFTVIVNVTFSLFAVFVHVTVVFPGFIPTNSISSSYIPSSISSNARTEESSTVHFN